jgi:hypothetical protein
MPGPCAFCGWKNIITKHSEEWWTLKSCQIFASVFGLHILERNLTSAEICLGLAPPFVDEKISSPNIPKNDGLVHRIHCCTFLGTRLIQEVSGLPKKPPPAPVLRIFITYRTLSMVVYPPLGPLAAAAAPHPHPKKKKHRRYDLSKRVFGRKCLQLPYFPGGGKKSWTCHI